MTTTGTMRHRPFLDICLAYPGKILLAFHLPFGGFLELQAWRDTFQKPFQMRWTIPELPVIEVQEKRVGYITG
jgi:hypothetical protein